MMLVAVVCVSFLPQLMVALTSPWVEVFLMDVLWEGRGGHGFLVVLGGLGPSQEME
jgi:hypothetical protein